MKLRNITAGLLGICMTVGLLTGCGSSTGNHNYDRGYRTMDADTVIAKVDNIPITWAEYYTWLYSTISSYESKYGKITDWSVAATENTTYGKYFQEYAFESIAYYKVIESQAGLHRINMDADDEAAIQEQITSAKEKYGSEEDFQAALKAEYMTEEEYDYLFRINYLDDILFADQFGADGEKLSQEDILEYIAEDGYWMTKHIFLTTENEDGEALDDSAKAAVRASAEDLLAQLRACSDDASRAALFDELMKAYSQDETLADNPDGYLFQEGDMGDDYEAAAEALEEYGVSDVVEADGGYYLILRLPINVDSKPVGSEYTLRYIVAYSMYDAVVDGWYDNADISTTDAYDNLSIEKMFGE